MKLRAIADSISLTPSGRLKPSCELIFTDWKIEDIEFDELLNSLKDVILKKGDAVFWLAGTDLSVATKFFDNNRMVKINILSGSRIVDSYDVQSIDLARDVDSLEELNRSIS